MKRGQERQRPSSENERLKEENRQLKNRVRELEGEVARLNHEKEFRERDDAMRRLASQRGPHY